MCGLTDGKQDTCHFNYYYLLDCPQITCVDKLDLERVGLGVMGVAILILIIACLGLAISFERFKARTLLIRRSDHSIDNANYCDLPGFPVDPLSPSDEELHRSTVAAQGLDIIKNTRMTATANATASTPLLTRSGSFPFATNLADAEPKFGVSFDLDDLSKHGAAALDTFRVNTFSTFKGGKVGVTKKTGAVPRYGSFQ